MVVTGTQPEGLPCKCVLCGSHVRSEASLQGDTVCPKCGVLCWPSKPLHATGESYRFSYGTVHLCLESGTGRKVQLFVVDSTTSDDRVFASRMLKEAEVLNKIRHTNITRVLFSGEVNGRVCVLMEDAGELPLRSWLERLGKLSIGDATNVALQCASGLHCLHQEGGLHRSINSESIAVGSDGVVRVTPWRGANPDGHVSRVEHAATMSPEQFLGQPPVSERTDVYALAATLYQMTAGCFPFRGESPLQLWVNASHDESVPLSRVVPSVPSGVSDVVQQALSKEPAKRPDIQEFAQRITEAGVANSELQFLKWFNRLFGAKLYRRKR